MSDEEKKPEKEEEKKPGMVEPDPDDPSVCVLSLEAYEQIILHATRFANTKVPMDAWKEVMGYLVGTVEENRVLVKKAIPMTHGSSVEVEFGEEQYVRTATINDWAAERNWFVVGWYHSHPGLGLFLSGTDITNHLGWQTSLNPHSVALVFDHTKIKEEGHPGFAVFKLDNPDLGNMSDFHAIRFEIEKIERGKYMKSLYEFSERAMLKQPLAPEFGEDVSALGGTSEDAGGVDISTTPLGNIEITLPSVNVDLVMEGMLTGFRRFTEEVIPPMLLASNDQSRATASAFQDLANKQVKTLNELQELLSLGVGELRKQVMAKIDDSHEGLVNMMATNFTDQKEVLTKATDDISDMEDRIIDDVVKTREEVLNQQGVKFSEITDTIAEELKEMRETLNDVQKDLVDQFKLSIEATHDELSNAIDLTKTQVLERLTTLKESVKPQAAGAAAAPASADVTQEIDKINKKIDEMKTTQNQILEKILIKIKALEDIMKPQ